MTSQEDTQLVSLAEVKNILKKVEKERKELLYEQRIALDHAQKFAKLSLKNTKDLIKELLELDFMRDSYAYKIADLVPSTEDDIKTIFAKERITLNETQIKNILSIVETYKNK